VYQTRSGWIHRFLVWGSALVMGVGLVLAAQGTGRAEMSAAPADEALQSLWVPGSNVPMAAYLRSQHDQLLAPPR
jgi:hypothetical protein